MILNIINNDSIMILTENHLLNKTNNEVMWQNVSL